MQGLTGWKTLLEINGAPYTVELGRLERQVLRNSLNLYKDQLEKSQKKDRELGVPNEATALMLAVIEGDNGWGQGLYDKLVEQLGLESEAEAEAREAAEKEAAVVSLRDKIVRHGGPIRLDVIRAWTPEQFAEALACAEAMDHAAENWDSEYPVGIESCPLIEDAVQAEIDARIALTERIAEFAAPQLPLSVVVKWTEEEVQAAAEWATGQAIGPDGSTPTEAPVTPEFLAAALKEVRRDVHRQWKARNALAEAEA